MSTETTHWSKKRESGAYFAMLLGISCYRVLGRRGVRLLLYPIIGYFFLRDASARRASSDFLARVYQFAPKGESFFSKAPTRTDSFNHFMNFGRSIVDRIASWTGDIRREELIFRDRQRLLDCIASGRGGVILSSHLGNAEMCRALLDKVAGVKMNVLVFNDNAAQINRMMKRLNPRADLELIQISRVTPGTAMVLNEKINKGEFIVIAADRTSSAAPEKSLQVPFMGEMASFPQGVFILAGLLACPVFLLFCLQKEEYHIYLEYFSDSMAMPRRERTKLLSQHIEKYAQRLQHYALMAPLQWFNFFDFWAQPENGDSPTNNKTPGLERGNERLGILE